MLGPRIETSVMMMIKVGKARTMSASRMIAESTQPAVEAGEGAKHDADRGVDRDGDEPDRERDTPGVEQPAEDVAAGGVGAEDVRHRGWFAVEA